MEDRRTEKRRRLRNYCRFMAMPWIAAVRKVQRRRVRRHARSAICLSSATDQDVEREPEQARQTLKIIRRPSFSLTI